MERPEGEAQTLAGPALKTGGLDSWSADGHGAIVRDKDSKTKKGVPTVFRKSSPAEAAASAAFSGAAGALVFVVLLVAILIGGLLGGFLAVLAFGEVLFAELAFAGGRGL